MQVVEEHLSCFNGNVTGKFQELVRKNTKIIKSAIFPQNKQVMCAITKLGNFKLPVIILNSNRFPLDMACPYFKVVYSWPGEIKLGYFQLCYFEMIFVSLRSICCIVISTARFVKCVPRALK